MKAIMNLLEENDFSMQQKKQAITQIVNELCISYTSLAQDYDLLKSSTSEHALNSESLLLNKLDDTKSGERWDGSEPESTVEDAETENEGDTTSDKLEHMKIAADNLTAEEENVLCKGMFNRMLKYSKVVEESAGIQIELIRKNSEKREMIIGLQDQVVSLMAQRDALLRKLSYFERNFRATSPKRRTRVKFFGCS
ncbi:hypothetical protein RND81_13G158400 [Saponaria officinalis]|uniref:NAB domain-containing protein n=1 Tax=Saponaria officinalis TaxID=3572 RepID=A0AAW1GYD2_SAPOF